MNLSTLKTNDFVNTGSNGIFKLLYYYLVIGGIALFIGGVAMAFLLNRHDRQAIKLVAEEQTTEIADNLNTRFYADFENFVATRDEQPVFSPEWNVTELNMVQLRLFYGNDARLDSFVPVYSLSPDFLETPIQDRTAFRDALYDGNVSSEYTDTAGEGTYLLTYVPFYHITDSGQKGQIVAVWEIQRNITPVKNAVADSNRTLTITLGLLGAIIFIIIAIPVGYAQMVIQTQHDDLQQQKSSLMLQLISRADLSHMTVSAIQELFRNLEPAPVNTPASKAYDRLEYLAENLSLIEQLERQQLQPDKKPFELDELLRDRATTFQGAKVIAESCGLGLVADRAMLAHVLDALLNNLAAYNPRQTPIILSAAYHEDTHIRITVALAAASGHEVDPHFAADQHLDLTVARLMVEKHSGSLEFQYGETGYVRFHALIKAH